MGAVFSSNQLAVGLAPGPPGNHDMERLKREIDCSVRVCVLGGAEFENTASKELVMAIAQKLATSYVCRCCGYIIGGTAGGIAGVAQTFLENCGDGSLVWIVLPTGAASSCGRGTDLHAGRNVEDVTNILGQLGDVYLTIEGGPEVSHVALAAYDRKKKIIPLIRTGGASSGLFDFPAKVLQRPTSLDLSQWELLSDADASIDACASAVAELVGECARMTFLSGYDLSSDSE